jgi:hypothetical protein
MSDTSVHGAVDKATDSTAFEYAARAGFAISGVLHLLIAFIVVRIAFGSGGNADQSGALTTISQQPGGALMLWAAAIGMAALALWHVAEAIVGKHPGERSRSQQDSEDRPAWKRAKDIGVAILYFAIAVSAARFAMGSGQSSGQQNTGITAQLLQSGWGKALLIAVGLGVIAVGGYHVYKGFSKKFCKDLRGSCSGMVEKVGVTGYIAKGLVFAGAGLLVIIASLTADPSKAAGLDAAVKTLGQAPYGKFLLILAAIGIAAFGAYSFVRSKHGRM